MGETPGNGACNYRHCPFIHCHIPGDDGSLFQCDPPMAYQKNMARLHVKREVDEDCRTDLYGAKDGYELLERLHRQIPFCKYCLTRKKIMFPWQGNYTQELTDAEMGVPGQKQK